MSTVEPLAYLRSVPLFSRLSDADVQRVGAVAHQEQFPRGSYLALAGRPGRAFYYILSGEAVVHAAGARGRQRPVAYLRPGDYFGVTSLLLGEPHDASTRATSDVAALVIGRDEFNHLRREHPELDDVLVLPEEVAAKLRHEQLPWLAPGEVVVFFAKRHWFVFARAMLLPTLAFLLLAAVGYALLGRLPAPWWGLSLLILGLVYLGIFVWQLIDWRNDYFVVTTQRIVHRELALYQYESRHEAPLNRVQDVQVKRSFWGNVLGFGAAHIETAAHAGIGHVLFDHLPNPEAAKDAIFQQLYRTQAQSRSAARESVRAELKRRLGWLTSEELEAEAVARQAAKVAAPIRPRRGWLPRLPRLLPPLRLVEGNRITWRKHWLFLLRRIWQPGLAIIALLLLFVSYLTGSAALAGPPQLGIVLGFVVAGLAVGFWLWWQVVDWENDIYILTEDRIVDIEKKPLFFSEDRREATLDRIQNVNLIVPNPVAAALHYGDVNIDTAGGEVEFTFTHVPAPHEVQREIMTRVARFRERQQQLESAQRRREIADWFAVYEDLRNEKKGPQADTGAPAEDSQPDS